MNEPLRQQIEKLLWEYYNPKASPNMEELSEKIVNLLIHIALAYNRIPSTILSVQTLKTFMPSIEVI